MFTPEQELIIRQVLRVVDLSGDLDRNRNDGEFLESGGEIIYVLDENVFEMFIRPYAYREAVETFYADIWRTSGQSSDVWRSFEAQAALITSEFLISRDSGGGASSPIFMTEQHRWELAHRIEKLTVEIRTRLEERNKTTRQNLARHLEIISDLEQGRIERAAKYERMHDDGTLARDIERLPTSTPASVVERFRVARVAAAFLANDQMTGPLDQLRRVVSHPIRFRLRSVQTQTDYRATGKEQAALEPEVEKWFERLADELRRPGHRSRSRAQREEVGKALWNDARSLAFLRWIVRGRLQSNQRLVFVTGDAVLFDAYRRWYLDQHSDQKSASSDVAEPFFMRRVRQFSPIFNPQDSGGDLSDPTQTRVQKSLLFTLIQQAVEASLLPLTLAMDAGGQSTNGGAFSPKREMLALKLIDREKVSDDEELSSFSEKLTSEWLVGRRNEIERIRSHWQEAQRLTIGASMDLIRARLGKELRETATVFFAEGAQDSAGILRQYVAGVLDQLVDESLQLWVPLADSFATQALELPRPGVPQIKRITVALDLSSRIGNGDRADPQALPKPEIVFARAACRALEAQDISNANRFAGLALRADNASRARGGGYDGFDLDLQYLHAVTYRLLISTVGSAAHSDRWASRGIDFVKSTYLQASKLIHKCLVAHSDEQGYLVCDDQHENSVRYLRALSERASLNLFMATSLGLSARASNGRIADESMEYLEIARGDLWLCVKLDGKFDDGEPTEHSILDAVRDQFIPNLAAFEVLAYILKGVQDYKVQPWPRKFLRRIRTFWEGNKNIHPLLNAELLGFAVLANEDIPKGRVATPKSYSHEMRALRLPLDRELYRAIRRELPRSTGGRR